MSADFKASFLVRRWTIKEPSRGDDVCATVIVEADFSVSTARIMFGATREGDPLGAGVGHKFEFWQFRVDGSPDYVLCVIYPNEGKPTIYASSLTAYREFLDYCEEGLTLLYSVGADG